MDVLKQITGFSLTHGMLCSMRRKTEQDAGELLRQISRENERPRRIAVLEVLLPYRLLRPLPRGRLLR